MQLADVLPYVKAAEPVQRDAPALALPEEMELVCRPFVGRLLIAYAVDEGTAYELVQREQLRKSGLDGDELHRRAVENLARKVAESGVRVQPYGQILAVFFDGNLEATLMLHAPLWQYLHRELGGALVVAAPSRDVLAVCATHDAQGISELRDLVGRVWPDGDHLLAQELLVRRDETWDLWQAV